MSVLNKLQYLREIIIDFLFLWLISMGITLCIDQVILKIIHYFGLTSLSIQKQVQDCVLHIMLNSFFLLFLNKKQEINKLFKPVIHFKRNIGIISVSYLVLIVLLTIWGHIQNEYLPDILGKKVPDNLYFSGIIHFVIQGMLLNSCLTPITEELLFRGFLQQRLYAIVEKKWLATTISAIIFSLLHGKIANSVNYLLGGCCLSYIYYKTSHILYPIIVHSINNLLVASAYYLFWKSL